MKKKAISVVGLLLLGLVALGLSAASVLRFRTAEGAEVTAVPPSEPSHFSHGLYPRGPWSGNNPSPQFRSGAVIVGVAGVGEVTSDMSLVR